MGAPGQRAAGFRPLRMSARGVKARASGYWSHTSPAAWVLTLLRPQAVKREARPDAHIWLSGP